MTTWEFGEFRLLERELLRGRIPVHVDRRPLKALVCLVASRPRIVSKEQLVVAAWDGAVVSDQTVDRAVSRIRAALGDDPGQPRFVQTVRGQGYRFIAAVMERGTDSHRPPVSAYVPGDRSRFVRDVDVPDGSIVRVRQQFTKRWEILNAGTVPWVGRYLERQGPAEATGRLRSPERTPIPETPPGQTCTIAVDLIAPDTPGSCYAEWKMVDERGRFCLPRQLPVRVSVDVRE